ncbi:MAG: multidrug effflux MFS transporter [Planctomycetales bacterium]|nr:multidrug effflux MFS transporter [Planctomycetales bacterium]
MPHPPSGLFTLLGVLSAFSPLAIDMYLSAFPQIERDLAAPAGSVQLTLSLFLLGLAVGQFVIGPVSDTLGRRVPLLLGCIGFGVTAWICGQATSIQTLAAARFAMGFAGSAGLVVSRAIVRDLYDERESAGVYSFMMMVMGIAPVVAPLVGAQIIAWSDWRTVFWILALVGWFSAAASARILSETLPYNRRTRFSVSAMFRRSFAILGNRQFVRSSLIIGGAAAALFGYIGTSPTLFIDDLGISPRWFSAIFASNAIGLFVAAQLNRWLLPKFGPRRLLHGAIQVATMIAGIFAICAATGWGGTFMIVSSVFGCVSILGLIFPNAIALAMGPFKSEAGAASAVLGLIQYALGATGGAIVGAVHNGTPAAMAVGILLCQIANWIMAMGLATEEQ